MKPKQWKPKEKEGVWVVYNKNFASDTWEIMKLIIDPRKKGKNKEGLAIYKTRGEAKFTEDIAQVISGGCIKTKVVLKKLMI